MFSLNRRNIVSRHPSRDGSFILAKQKTRHKNHIYTHTQHHWRWAFHALEVTGCWYVRRPETHCWRANTRIHSQREKERQREKKRGRICLIVWPTLTDGPTLPKEQCDWENGPSVTLAVCVFVCVLMHVWQCYKSKCYTSIVSVPLYPTAKPW